jgi:hypothetical protein
VVQVDRWGQPNRKHLQNDFLEANYLLAKPKGDSYLGRITPAEVNSRVNLYFPFWEYNDGPTLGLCLYNRVYSVGLIALLANNVPEWNYRTAFRTIVTY